MSKRVEIEAEVLRKFLEFIDRSIEQDPSLVIPIAKEEFDEIEELVKDVDFD